MDTALASVGATLQDPLVNNSSTLQDPLVNNSSTLQDPLVNNSSTLQYTPAYTHLAGVVSIATDDRVTLTTPLPDDTIKIWSP